MTIEGQSDREKRLFEEALERPAVEERDRFLKVACGEDAMIAVEYANEHALRSLAFVFPETVQRALHHRKKGDHVA